MFKTFSDYVNYPGDFVALRPSEESKEGLRTYMTYLANITEDGETVDPEELHLTLVFSRRPLSGYAVPGNVFYTATPSHLELFGECLVLRVYCQGAVDRHYFLQNQHGAQHDFPDYLPHITLMKGCHEMPDAICYSKDITLNREYHEVLKEN